MAAGIVKRLFEPAYAWRLTNDLSDEQRDQLRDVWKKTTELADLFLRIEDSAAREGDAALRPRSFELRVALQRLGEANSWAYNHIRGQRLTFRQKLGCELRGWAKALHLIPARDRRQWQRGG